MSWKQYGGINKLEKTNNLNVNSVSTDTLRLHKPYHGGFDISGVLSVYDDAELKKNVHIFGDLDVSNNVYVTGDLTVNKKLNISSIQTTANIFVGTNLSVDGNASFGSDVFLYSNLYFVDFNQSGNVLIHKEGEDLGINTLTPQATLDINGTNASVLSVYSTQEYTRNIIAQNSENRGISVSADTISSSIEFFNDSSLNSGIEYDGRIMYTNGGDMEISVSVNKPNFLSNCNNPAPFAILI
jgi:hypothetical protein